MHIPYGGMPFSALTRVGEVGVYEGLGLHQHNIPSLTLSKEWMGLGWGRGCKAAGGEGAGKVVGV